MEGPEVGVYYRGKDTISNGETQTIELPNYVVRLAYDFTVQLTPIRSSNNLKSSKIVLQSSKVVNGKFTVYGNNGSSFFWLVYAKRSSVQVELPKMGTEVKGDGPYRWIQSTFQKGGAKHNAI